MCVNRPVSNEMPSNENSYLIYKHDYESNLSARCSSILVKVIDSVSPMVLQDFLQRTQAYISFSNLASSMIEKRSMELIKSAMIRYSLDVCDDSTNFILAMQNTGNNQSLEFNFEEWVKNLIR
jgi:hypothetical protein